MVGQTPRERQSPAFIHALKEDFMFTQRATYYPATGKGPEVRALLEALTQSEQARGIQVNLTTQHFNPDGPAFVRSVRLADLAALAQRRASVAADPARQEHNAKLDPLLGRPAKVELFETIVPLAGPAGGVYIERITWTPAFGKGPELQKVLEEQIMARQAQGMRGALSVQLFSPTGPAFASTLVFPDLAVYEQFRKARSTDAAVQTFAAKARALMTTPQKVELFEILTPFPE